MKPIIFQVHVHGNYYAGDHIDIHDNPFASFYQSYPFPTNTRRTDHLEDVTPADISETRPAEYLFCRITQAAYDKGVAQTVDNELRSAAVSAPKLVKAIKTNEALGYLDTKNLNSAVLYKLLYEHFGLGFGLRTFQKYRNI
jgi:hypothetical protein